MRLTKKAAAPILRRRFIRDIYGAWCRKPGPLANGSLTRSNGCLTGRENAFGPMSMRVLTGLTAPAPEGIPLGFGQHALDFRPSAVGFQREYFCCVNRCPASTLGPEARR